MSKRYGRYLTLNVVLLCLTLILSGCVRLGSGNTGDTTVQLWGKVYIGDTGIPFTGARIVVGNRVSETYQGGTWSVFLMPGSYTGNISTIFGSDSFEVLIQNHGQPHQKHYHVVQLPAGFDRDVYYDLAFVDLVTFKRVLRWKDGTTIRYAFNGGTKEHQAKFEQAINEWLDGTQLVEFGRIAVEKAADVRDANVIVTWGAETATAKTFDSYVTWITGATIYIATTEADNMLPYYVAVGEMFGLNKISRPGSVMSVNSAPDTTVSAIDRAYLMALYSTPLGFSFQDPQWWD